MKCLCGCGRETGVVTQTSRARGIRKGDPRSYCKGHQMKAETDKERFSKRLVSGPDGCILFVGPQQRGYGLFKLREGGTRTTRAHRFAWSVAGRSYPEGKPYLLHLCDNRQCVNVAHLRPGTAAENNADMARRGRGRRGSLPFGVYKHGSRFGARVVTGNRAKHLGTYSSVEEAHAVALAAKSEIYGAEP